jgi:hypothetical protein
MWSVMMAPSLASASALTPDVSQQAQRLRQQAEVLRREGRLATAWQVAVRAGELDPVHLPFVEGLLDAWLGMYAVTMRIDAGAADASSLAVVDALRDEVDSGLVSWVASDDAWISGTVGVEQVQCSEEHVSTRELRHPVAHTSEWWTYAVEKWTRTCTVGLFGSMRVGSRSLMMARRIHISIDDVAWRGQDSVGLVGNPLRFDEDDGALQAQASEVLVHKAGASIQQQLVRFVRERVAAREPGAEELSATDALLSHLTGTRPARRT